MSATIAYSSAPFAWLGQIQIKDVFASTAANLNTSVTSSSVMRLLSVDGQTHGELIYGEVKAIGGEELFDFGYMIARQAANQLEILDQVAGEMHVFPSYPPGIGDLSSLKFAIGLDETFEMSSSARKDLFIAVTLPLLGMGAAIFAAVAGSYAYTLSASSKLDDSLKAVTALVAEQSKTQAVANQQISTISKSSDDSSAKLDKVVEQLNQMNATLLVMKSQKEEKLKAN